MLDAGDSAQLAQLVAKGAGGTLFLETDDCQASYDELSKRGVTFNDPPTPQAYGIDTSFRDPSGNNIRLTQVLEFDPTAESTRGSTRTLRGVVSPAGRRDPPRAVRAHQPPSSTDVRRAEFGHRLHR